MSRALSADAKRAIFAPQTDVAFIILLTISHPAFTDDVRLTNDAFETLPVANVWGVVSNGLEYVYAPFNVILPNQDETGVSRASITIENIDRRLVQSIRAADSSLSVSIQIVLSSDVDSVELTADDFKLERVTYNAIDISGDLTLEYFDNEPVPWARFTPSNFPGMF